MNWQWLEQLCALPGISGRESAVRDWIIGHLPSGVPYEVDPLGNLIVNKSSENIMLCAHMDEVGLMVTFITDEGYLKFSHVGGVSHGAYLGRKVFVGEAQLPGVVGVTPMHLLEGDGKKALPKLDSLYIDLGAENRAEAERYVAPGDFITFAPGFTSFGEDYCCAKAIDDRVGCLILLELLREHPEICAVFSVLEEVGAGAAGAAAFGCRPKYAIVLETTTAADLPGVSGAERVCALGAGVVVPFMDKGTVYPYDLYQQALKLAQQKGIPAQTKTAIAGGNDAKSIHASGAGVPTVALSVPCRSLHSPNVVMMKSDAQAVYDLAELLWKELMSHDQIDGR